MKNISRFIVLFLLTCEGSSSASAQDSLYIKEYDWNILFIGFGKGDMMLCKDKSIVTIAPNQSANSPRKNYKLIKLDEDANFLWATELINTWAHASISEDDEGNILIATIDSSSHALIIKVSSNGGVLWSQRCPNVSLSRDVVTIDDYHYLIGSAEAGSSSNDYYFVTKFNFNGNLVWTKHYNISYSVVLQKSIKTADNNILVTSNFDSGLIYSEPHLHTFKLDTSGAILWSKKHSAPSNYYVYDAVENVNGDFALTGAIYNYGPSIFYFLIDANGNYKYSRTYFKYEFQEGFGIYPTSEGGYMICAEPEAYFDKNVPQIAMMRIDETGAVETLIVHDISSDGAFPIGCAQDDYGYFISGIRLDSSKLITMRTTLTGEIFCNEIYETITSAVSTSTTSSKSMTAFPGPIFNDHSVPQFFYSVSDLTTCSNKFPTIDTTKYTPIIPNVFSPNGDGVNDFFFITYPFSIGYSFSVIDRWGQSVFQSLSPNDSWDGIVQGSSKPATAGVYFYLLTIEDQSWRGTLTLIR